MTVRKDREDESRGYCLQEKGLTIPGKGEAFALLDQGQEITQQPTGRVRGIVRRSIPAGYINLLREQVGVSSKETWRCALLAVPWTETSARSAFQRVRLRKNPANFARKLELRTLAYNLPVVV